MNVATHLRLVQGDRGELELNTALVRRFLGIEANEFVELTAFVEGRIHVAQCHGEDEQVRLLREAETIRGFNGAYMLVNGPIDPSLSARYEQCQWQRAFNGRAADRDVRQLRAVFLDCDPVRPKGISSTDEQLHESCEVSNAVETWLADTLGGPAPIGHGCSGNGYFTLIAIEPVAPTAETTRRIADLLGLLNTKFGTPRVKIDTSVFNPARLMPAPGTWKCKGRDTAERPHRMTSFICRPNVVRVPLESLC
ncbi:MAG: hypothetical protein QM756_26590 [Polyangiaceae bacterium]